MTGDAVADVLSSPYFVAAGVPLLLVLVGAVARKLVRGTAWIRQDFYLGIDLALAALSAGLIYLYDVLQLMKSGTAGPGSLPPELQLLRAASFIALSILILLVVMAFHQDHERKPRRPLKQFLLLGIVSNFVSGGLLAVFIFLVKGVPAP
jgi:hypothetical protein